jgi:ADP-ribose pyrophosphatase YjhB (NUDIX family)
VSSGIWITLLGRGCSREDLIRFLWLFRSVSGACKDVLADLLAKFGRVPIVQRVLPVPEGKIKEGWQAAAWVAGGLVFDEAGRIALVRHHAHSGWEESRWVPPGGILEAGETADQAFRREVREETGLEVADLHVTRIFNNAYEEPSGKRYPFYFVQFVARAKTRDLHPDDSEVREAAWFDALPEGMAFHEDYAEDYQEWRERFRGAGKP